MILLFHLSFFALPSLGQSDTANTKPVNTEYIEKSFALFETDDLLEVTMQLDLVACLRKNLKGDAKDAVLTFHLSETDSLQEKISLKTRGNFRLENCAFPPLQIKFKNPINAFNNSGPIKKIKLVTHCGPGNMYDDYVLREFLVYRMFNLLTDTSYKVRLLRINYIDIKNRRKPVTQYGFLFEPNSILAERINSVIVESTKLNQQHIVPSVLDRVAIFNYMVSNWDWSVPGQQNIIVLKTRTFDNPGLALAVPYDFDHSGVVNANYAVVHPEYDMENVRDRIFLGICRTEEVFRDELNVFLAKKKDLYSLISEFPYLNQRSKADITGFLDQFFNQIEEPKTLDKLINIFTKECKKL